MTAIKTLRSPVFVLGSPRSGTTFAISLLTLHSRLFGFNETLFYEYTGAHKLRNLASQEALQALASHLLGRLKTRTRDTDRNFGCTISTALSAQIETEFNQQLEQIELPCVAHTVLELFMSICTEAHGKQRWVEKTPNHVFYIDCILRDFPDARLVHISREPVSYLTSYKFSRYREDGVVKTGRLYHPLVTAYLWNRAESAIADARENFGTATILSTCYEDLAADTSTELARICAHIGVDFEPGMLDIRGDNTSFQDGRKQLDSWELAVCTLVCRKNMLRNGYKPRYGILSGCLALVPAILTLPAFLLHALPAIKKHYHGSLLHYVNTRLLNRH